MTMYGIYLKSIFPRAVNSELTDFHPIIYRHIENLITSHNLKLVHKFMQRSFLT